MNRQSVFFTFAKYVSFNILAMIGVSCNILADTYFIANGLGANALAALNLAIPLYSVICGIGLMIGIGGATRYAVCTAQGNAEEAGKIFSLSLLMGILAGIFIALMGFSFAGTICTWLGADAETWANARVYLQTIFSFAPFFIMNSILAAFVRNDGNPKTAMFAMIAGNGMNIVLDYLFIFPLDMGMFGAAFATGVAPVLGILVSCTHFISAKNHLHISKILPKPANAIKICMLGGSALIIELSSGVVIAAYNISILKHAGNIGVAAYGVVANIALVVLAILNGITQGSQPLLSRAYGGGNTKEMKQVLRYGLLCALFCAAFIYGGMQLFSEPIVSIFNSEQNAILSQHALQGIKIYFIAFLFSGINIMTAAYFSATQRPQPSFIIALLRGGLVNIPALLIFSHLFGMNGVWLSYPAAELITLGVSVIFLVRQSKHPLAITEIVPGKLKEGIEQI